MVYPEQIAYYERGLYSSLFDSCNNVQVPVFDASNTDGCAQSLCLNCTVLSGGCP
jgi:hypothetical protein